MSDRILQITTFKIYPGKLHAFKESIKIAVKFAEEQGPQLLVEVYIDEANMRAHSCQIQRDSEAILAHWRMSDPYIRTVMENCTLTHIEIYGNPNDAVLKGMHPIVQEGVTLKVTPAFVGFGRFTETG